MHVGRRIEASTSQKDCWSHFKNRCRRFLPVWVKMNFRFSDKCISLNNVAPSVCCQVIYQCISSLALENFLLFFPQGATIHTLVENQYIPPWRDKSHGMQFIHGKNIILKSRDYTNQIIMIGLSYNLHDWCNVSQIWRFHSFPTNRNVKIENKVISQIRLAFLWQIRTFL